MFVRRLLTSPRAFWIAAVLALAHLGWTGWNRNALRIGLQEPLLSELDLQRDRAELERELARLEPAELQHPGLVLVLLEGMDPEHASELSRLSRGRPGVLIAGGAGDPMDLPPVLAGRLEAEGWRTLGLSAAHRESKSKGPGRGFDLWLGKELSRGRSRLPYVDAGRLAELLPDLLAQLPGSLLLLRAQDPGLPWIPRRGFADEALLEADTLPAGARRPVSQGFDAAWSTHLAGDDTPRSTLRSWDEAKRAELRFLDHHLGPLLMDLEAPVILLAPGSEPGDDAWLAAPPKLSPPADTDGLLRSVLSMVDVPEG